MICSVKHKLSVFYLVLKFTQDNRLSEHMLKIYQFALNLIHKDEVI